MVKKKMMEAAKDLSIELNYKVRADGVTMDDLPQYLFSGSEIAEGLCKLTSLRENMENEPFSIYNDFSKDVIVEEVKYRIGAENDPLSQEYSLENVQEAFVDYIGEYTIDDQTQHNIKVKKITEVSINIRFPTPLCLNSHFNPCF